MKKPRIVALLPMKANSQRVQGKNFRDFCGKPLFRWVLDTLLEIKDIDKIVINTDAVGILEEHGVVSTDRIVIRKRAPKICGDDVSMNLVIADDVLNVKSDLYLMTHTTNPFLSADTIQTSIDKFIHASGEGIADSLFTVNKIQSRFYSQDGSPVNHDPKRLVPTQQLEPWYEENSNLYIFTRESFARTSARIGSQPIMYESPLLESVDIDTPSDWEFAKIVSMYLNEIRRASK
ncbi:acylneuraminate cytidylyltransferase family protein [Pseudohongiella sp. SYSU M77423]|uniref:acylneuraminate cytidylyltransferase family protein n=1 Tax=Pseudohongiella sp. SYSU M77423 TaxID=3042312 RepID=UPI0024802E21|nr:acylneuraminate cytidylyltransferase family protein [Pseudohongiella sp. SYSU M77423]MDH7944938.1 acylneuraminate cytidylyltransferase family protein [Pseudohongiella sp. SYSU M77423]